MISDTYVLAQACAVLCDGSLKAGELLKRLSARGVSVEKSNLNRVLSNAKRSILGLDFSAEDGWSFTTIIGARSEDEAAVGGGLPRSRLDRFIHQLAWHLRQLERNNDPTEDDVSRLRDLAGQFAAQEVDLLVQRREERRALRAASADLIASVSLAAGSQPYQTPVTLASPVTLAYIEPTTNEDPRSVTKQPAPAESPLPQKKPNRKKEAMAVKAERRDDGIRVERWYDEQGRAALEIAAKINVQQLGSDETGVVYLTIWDMPAAREHFDVAKEKVKAAGGKYSQRKWRFLAAVGLRVVEELAADGYEIERQPLDLDNDVYDALSSKFLGPDQYRSGRHWHVTLSPVGFVVEVSSGERLPCTVGEALVLDDAGWTFSSEAHACLLTIRSAAGFANAGRRHLQQFAAGTPSTVDE